MNITDVRVRKIASTGKLRAYVSITFDDEFVVHDIRIIEGDKGLFVAMPRKHIIMLTMQKNYQKTYRVYIRISRIVRS